MALGGPGLIEDRNSPYASSHPEPGAGPGMSETDICYLLNVRR